MSAEVKNQLTVSSPPKLIPNSSSKSPNLTGAPTTLSNLNGVSSKMPSLSGSSSKSRTLNGSTNNLLKRPKSAAVNAADKLEDINKQIADIRKQRQEASLITDGRVSAPKKDYSQKPKKTFHHPHLDFVIGEIVYSPYMTKPQERYPDQTFQMVGKLREMKRRGVSFLTVPEHEKPYCEKTAKNIFIKEVVNYNPAFSDPEHELKAVNIRASTGNLASYFSQLGDSTNLSNSTDFKSLVMQSAEARGGPVKFKKQFKELQVRRTPSSRSLIETEPLGSTSRRSSLGNGELSEKIAPIAEEPDQSTQSVNNITPFLTDSPLVTCGEDEAQPSESDSIVGVSSASNPNVIIDQSFQKLETVFSGDVDDVYAEPFEAVMEAPPTPGVVRKAIAEEDEDAIYEEEVFEPSAVEVTSITVDPSSLQKDIMSSVPSGAIDGSPTVILQHGVDSLSADPVYEEDFDAAAGGKGDDDLHAPLEEVMSPPVHAPQFSPRSGLSSETIDVPKMVTSTTTEVVVEDTYQDDFAAVEEVPTLLLDKGERSAKRGKEEDAVRNNYIKKEEQKGEEDEIRDDSE